MPSRTPLARPPLLITDYCCPVSPTTQLRITLLVTPPPPNPLRSSPPPPQRQNGRKSGKTPNKQVWHPNPTRSNKPSRALCGTTSSAFSALATSSNRPSTTSSRLAPAASPPTLSLPCFAPRLQRLRSPRLSKFSRVSPPCLCNPARAARSKKKSRKPSAASLPNRRHLLLLLPVPLPVSQNRAPPLQPLLLLASSRSPKLTSKPNSTSPKSHPPPPANSTSTS